MDEFILTVSASEDMVRADPLNIPPVKEPNETFSCSAMLWFSLSSFFFFFTLVSHRASSPDHVIWSCSVFHLPEQVRCLSASSLRRPRRKSLRSCAFEVCLQFVIRGTLRVTAVSHKEWGQLVAKLSLIAKELAAVDPACKSFKFGPKSCLTTVTGLKTVFSRNHSR